MRWVNDVENKQGRKALRKRDQIEVRVMRTCPSSDSTFVLG